MRLYYAMWFRLLIVYIRIIIVYSCLKIFFVSLSKLYTVEKRCIETTNGKQYRYCFEYGYCELPNDFIELQMNADYLDYQ
jgi:uncharacterized Tic20 family protein